MSRIPTPATIDAMPAASRPLLEAVEKQLGVVPNMFRLIAHSPAALQGYSDPAKAKLSKKRLKRSRAARRGCGTLRTFRLEPLHG
jgi:hypothetical protein